MHVTEEIFCGSWSGDELAFLEEIGEYFAAGFLRGGKRPVILRMASGLKNQLEKVELPAYRGERLYPSGKVSLFDCPIISHHYQKPLCVNTARLEERKKAATGKETQILSKLVNFCSGYPPATIGGGKSGPYSLPNYTHSIPHFERILEEGLFGLQRRIADRAKRYSDHEKKQEVFLALDEVLAGLESFVERCRDHLIEISYPDDEREEHRRQLAVSFGALARGEITTFREAMAACNLIYYLDGCDSLGRIDQVLAGYYEMDKRRGAITPDAAQKYFEELWANVDLCEGWNAAVGGGISEGGEAANELTLLALRAAEGRRRPNLALRIRKDTPDTIWDQALETIASGNGLPALYCEENYLEALEEAHLNIAEQDLFDFAFGGCTETMIHGLSNVDSLGGDLHTLKVLEETLYIHLEESSTFEDLLKKFKKRLAETIADMTGAINSNQKQKAAYYPQLIRTLFIDDCVDRGSEYYAGGARYNWSVVNVTGLGNTVDALHAVRRLIYEGNLEPEDLLYALRNDFNEAEELQRRMLSFSKYGNACPEVDELAESISGHIFQELKKYAPWRGGRFLGSCLMFTTYDTFGKHVGATPDGRSAGAPIADSAGAVQGRDRSGPTALLRSVTSLKHREAPGTLVVNIRFARDLLTDREGRKKVRSLLRTYFELGGMQIQVNVVDQEILQDALEHPENHEDLIIRVGGYSEYFNRLTDELKLSIFKRTEHMA